MTERDFAKLNLHMDIFHRPLRSRFFESLVGGFRWGLCEIFLEMENAVCYVV